MNSPIRQSTRLTDMPVGRRALDVQQQADSLMDRVEEVQAEQQVALESSPLASEYSAALAAQIEAKHDQAERIEDRLENMIEQQEARLMQIEAKQPGILALPGQRARWQNQVQQQQTLLQRLHTRLENVREIKDGMGVHAPRIEELATRKLRQERPELAEEWDEMREAQRRHQALMRKKEQDRRERLARERDADEGQSLGRGRTLGLSQTSSL
ncbi:IncP plasmid survival protein KfrC family protein [Burkholderia cenocepacia]|uniref:IncP plasmid survival protein KfrC family protein n=1 Tax=Burkholderia cenocepacia TaxID=95486 RepID=UPI002ABDF61C|nr:IncP plasmid survival protein KfrC family protein [Burkholderia cenocepacia]